MKKSLEKALEAYPVMMVPSIIDNRFKDDANRERRGGFIEGYEKAEADNPPLTGEDMKKIYTLVVGQYNKYLGGDWNGQCWGEEFYNEVLNKFNEGRKK